MNDLEKVIDGIDLGLPAPFAEPDSEKLAGILEQMGYVRTESEHADFIIYNTCTVRENANRKVYGHLGLMKHLKEKNPEMKIALCGCMMQEQHVQPDKNFEVREYIEDMPALLAAADLVISRSGALTLAELEAVGRAAVLIPSPNVAENHQYYNALELQKAGAAVVIEEKDLTGEKLVSTVSELLAEPGKLAAMGQNARRLSVDDSLDRIADALLKLVKTP